MLDAEREAAAAARQLAAAGFVVGTAGNVSARSGERIAITPTGAMLAELEPDQVGVVDHEGRLLSGELEPTSEIELHLGVYRRYEAGAVVHTHAPIATALSCVLDALRGRSAALMANHGALVYAADPLAAVEGSLLLEWACEVYWRAAAIGEPATLDDDAQAAVVRAAVERGYGTTKRAAARDQE
jgi:L-fuculose-phosphate aldolase